MSCTQRNLDYGSKSPTARVITNKRKCEKPSSAASRFAPWMRCGASRKHTSYLCCRLSEHAIQNTHRAVIVNTSASNCTHKNSMLIHCAYIWCVCVCGTIYYNGEFSTKEGFYRFLLLSQVYVSYIAWLGSLSFWGLFGVLYVLRPKSKICGKTTCVCVGNVR